MQVQIEQLENAALLTLDNPPVNAIGHALREGLGNAIRAAEELENIDRIILTGRGRAFAAGADAREFDAEPLAPHLPDLLLQLEQCRLPVIAAVNGVALGGGAEILLACRYRIAVPAAQIGFPEVNLGVVPGAGGTQRLPRLTGVKVALQLVSTGRPAKSQQALEHGLIDKIADDPLQAALKLDLSLLSQRQPLSEMSAPEADQTAIREARENVKKKMRGQLAPLAAIELIECSTKLAFKEASKKERETFVELRKSDQAKALRHLFFAERAAIKPPPDIDTEALTIDAACVVGGGTMGAAIAYALCNAGIALTLIETDAAGVERARKNVSKIFESAVKRGLLDSGIAGQRFKDMTFKSGYDDLQEVQLVVEAAFENMDAKKEIFRALDVAVADSAILASNTSYLDINELASVVGKPERVLGLHFFSPAHIMKLLEVVRAEATSPLALATAFRLAKRLSKIPVVSGVCDGFIGNRILMSYREAIDGLLIDGAMPWQIDEAMVEFGYAMGPYAMQDMAGLDISYAERQRRAPTRDPNKRYVEIGDKLVESGRLGQKSGAGWYSYGDGAKDKKRDPFVEALIHSEAEAAGVSRKSFDSTTIQQIALNTMAREAQAILDEGIAASATDIDLVLVHGYGFPRWRGGLMFYADAGLNA